MEQNLPAVGAPVEPTVMQHTPGPWVADLLSALRDLEAMAERYRQPGAPIPDAQKKARAAIAKAVGRAA